jgi:hypothetical protein
VTTTIPWLIMVAWLTYQHGIKQDKMPEPYHYLGATAAISIAALVSTFNRTLGVMLAWGVVIAVFLKAYESGGPSIAAKSEKGSAVTSASGTGGDFQAGTSPAPTQPTISVL